MFLRSSSQKLRTQPEEKQDNSDQRQLGLRQLGPPYDGQLGPLFKDNSDQYLVFNQTTF
jgi:hypothetical protein